MPPAPVLLVFLVERFHLGNTHQLNAVLGHGNDFETQSVKFYRFAHRRHLTVVGQQEPPPGWRNPPSD